ncbi:hypothetical protein ONK29_27185, partial [Salmonella enterica subsp. enterica serovar Anatum]|nr:hypothetical protein [Salmonella enterica subsp. enterica serovar Anatum]
ERHPFSRNENLWVANQNDPNEARAQLITLRQSVLKLTGDVMNVSNTILDWAQQREMGFSYFIALGDSLDIDVDELLDYLARDSK